MTFSLFKPFQNKKAPTGRKVYFQNMEDLYYLVFWLSDQVGFFVCLLTGKKYKQSAINYTQRKNLKQNNKHAHSMQDKHENYWVYSLLQASQVFHIQQQLS